MLLKHKMFSILSVFLASSMPLIADLNDDLEQLRGSHTQFAFSLFPVVDSEDTNLVFSPYCISSCLSMVYLGSRGETQLQMQKALHLEVDRKNIAKTTFALNQSLLPEKNQDKTYQLNIANAVWVDRGTFLLTDFRYAIEEQFKAKLAKINFSAADNALFTINKWVFDQTQGKIPSLLAPSDIDALTRLVLTNAVYFEGAWACPFEAKLTQDWPFHASPDTSLAVKMMHQILSIPYYENELMQAAAIPFVGKSNAGGSLALILLLPKSADNLGVMFNQLPNQFLNWLCSFSLQRIDIKLPKFTIDTRLNLREPLQQLGMEDAFDSDANFVGINGMQDLFLNKAIHQVYFSLDEKGVTATAATAGSMNVKSILEPPQVPIPLILDHPFLFFIVDLKSQEMLFMGKVVNPSKQ
jgi:serpin B